MPHANLPPGIHALRRSSVWDGARWKEVKNLGWLLRHASEVESFDVLRGSGGNDALLVATLLDHRVYATPYASFAVLANFLNRPSFVGLPAVWLGKRMLVGPALPGAAEELARNKAWHQRALYAEHWRGR